MPTILEEAGYRFYFYLGEPKYKVPHIQCSKGKRGSYFLIRA